LSCESVFLLRKVYRPIWARPKTNIVKCGDGRRHRRTENALHHLSLRLSLSEASETDPIRRKVSLGVAILGVALPPFSIRVFRRFKMRAGRSLLSA